MSNAVRILFEIRTRGEQEISRLDSSLKNVNTAVDGVRQSFTALAGRFAFITGALAGVGLSFRNAIRSFADFDDTMRAVAAVSGANAAEYRNMSEAAKQMGVQTRYTAAEAAEALKFLSMAGLDAAEATRALPQVLTLAAAASLDLGTAADIATNIMTGFGRSARDLGQINDVLVKTFTSSNTNLRELGSAFGYVGPIAKEMGVSFEEVAAALGLLADAGYKGGKGGTALRNILTVLVAPTTNVSALFEKLGLDAESLGLKLHESSDALKSIGVEVRTTAGGVRPLNEILEQLQGRLAEIPGAADRSALLIKIFGREAGPAMAALLSQGSVALRDFNQELLKSSGESARVAREMEAGIGGSMRELNSAVQGLVLSMGEGLERAFNPAIRMMTAFVREVSDANSVLRPFLSLFVGAGGLIAAKVAYELVLRKVFLLLGSMVVVPVVAFFTALTAAINAAIVAVAAFGIGLNAATGGLLALAAAAGYAVYQIGRLAVALYQWRDAAREARQAQADLAHTTETIGARSDERARSIGERLGIAVRNVQDFNRLIEAGTVVYDKTTNRWELATKAIAEHTETVRQKSREQLRLEEKLSDDLIRLTTSRFEYMRHQAKKHYEERLAIAQGDAELIAQVERAYQLELRKISQEQEAAIVKSSRKGSVDLLREQRDLELAMIQAQTSRFKASTQTALASLDELYEKGKVSLERYFDERRSLLDEQLQVEVEALGKQIALEDSLAGKVRLQANLYERQEQHKRDLIRLTQQQEAAENRVAQSAERVRQILADMKVRTLYSSDNLRERFEGERLYMEMMHDEELSRLEELNATKDQMNDAFRKQQLEKDRLMINQERALWDYRLRLASDLAGGLSNAFADLYELSGKKNKEFFYLAKAAAIAEAIINTSQAITKALAQGGIWGVAHASVLAAMGGVQIAKIRAQQLAYGGPVLGRSPHKRADNVPVMATAGEFMQPVDTVRYYGLDVMEALRRRLIPKDIFKRLNLSVPAPPMAFALAAGGSVPQSAGQTFSVSVPVNITATEDARRLAQALPDEIERTVVRVMRDHMR